MSRNIVTLRFAEGEDAPTVTGEWGSQTTAESTFRRWVGWYGANPSAKLRFVAEDDGRTTLLGTWPETTAHPH